MDPSSSMNGSAVKGYMNSSALEMDPCELWCGSQPVLNCAFSSIEPREHQPPFQTTILVPPETLWGFLFVIILQLLC